MGRGKRKSFDYCVDDIAIQTNGKKKKFQKEILCKNTECPRIKVMTADTEPLEKTNLTHPEGRVAVKRRKSKSFVNMQGDSKSPTCECDPKKLFKSSKRKRVTIIEPELKKYVHKGDIDDLCERKEETNTVDADRLSLKSMLRRSKTYPYAKQKCACVGKIIYNDEKAQTETVLNKNKKIGNKRMKHNRDIDKSPDAGIPKTDIKLVMKPKPNGDLKQNKEDKKTRKSKSPCICPKDTKKTEHFVDASKKRETIPTSVDCTDATCFPKIGNFKDKMACICRKYSKNVLSNKRITLEKVKEPTPLNDAACNEGICKTAIANKTDNFFCRCIKKTKQTECTEETCNKNDKKISLNSPGLARASKLPTACEPSCRKPCFKDLLRSKFRSGSQAFDDFNRVPYNQCEQTGEPFMEIKVDAVGMSVLNPNEIKGKVIDLSKTCKANPTCLCRSHKKHREKMIDKDLCEGGICHKTFRNKRTSFNCKCEKIGECTDNTCNSAYVPNSRPPQGWPTASQNPDFEVKLDSKRMHVLNPDEIHQKIMDMETESKELANAICPDGMCGAAKAANQAYFKCKCVERKRKPEEIRECSEATCAEEGARFSETEHTDLVCYLLSKVQSLIGKNKRHKMGQRSFNFAELGNIKSIFSLSSRPKKRQRRSAPNPNYYNPNNHGRHRREGLKINLSKTHPDTCTCNICNAKVQASLGCRCKSFIRSSISGLTHRHKYTVNKPNQNYHRRNDMSFPPRYQPPKLQKRQTQYSYPSGNFAQVTEIQTEEEKQAEIENKYNKNNICACSNICECADIMDKERRKKKEKRSKEQSKQKQHLDKSKQREKHIHDLEKDKEFKSADKRHRKLQAKRDKIEAKRRIKLYKQEQKEMKELSKQDDLQDTNCLVDFLIGLVKVTFSVVKGILTILFKAAIKPERSYRYVRQRMRDPQGTWDRFMIWVTEKWTHQKFRMNRTIKGSRTMTILTDEIKDGEIYQAFAYKGKTKEEKAFIEAADKRRKKRILKRHNEALYGCRHMLLVTLRKRPCMWVYHICPGFYAQFLSLRMFVLTFGQMLLFCLAVVVWTPCIACCELCRGLMCCMLCTR